MLLFLLYCWLALALPLPQQQYIHLVPYAREGIAKLKRTAAGYTGHTSRLLTPKSVPPSAEYHGPSKFGNSVSKGIGKKASARRMLLSAELIALLTLYRTQDGVSGNSEPSKIAQLHRLLNAGKPIYQFSKELLKPHDYAELHTTRKFTHEHAELAAALLKLPNIFDLKFRETVMLPYGLEVQLTSKYKNMRQIGYSYELRGATIQTQQDAFALAFQLAEYQNIRVRFNNGDHLKGRNVDRYRGFRSAMNIELERVSPNGEPIVLNLHVQYIDHDYPIVVPGAYEVAGFKVQVSDQYISIFK